MKALVAWCVAGLLLAIGARFLPLFGVVDYDFSLLLSLFATVCGASVAIAVMREWKGGPSVRAWLDASFRSMLPVIVATVFLGLLSISCFDPYGLLFIILMPLVSCMVGASVGMVIGSATRHWLAHTIVPVVVLLSIVWDFMSFHESGVMVFYNPFYGYFAGPLYDDVVRVSKALVAYRVWCVAIALLIACLTELCFRLRIRKSDAAGQSDLAIFTGLLVVSGLAVAAGMIWGKELGYKADRSTILGELDGRFASKHFEYFYPLDSRVEKNIGIIAEDHEFHYRRNVEFLDGGLTTPLQSFLYIGRNQKKRLTGAGRTMYADISGGAMHLNTGGFPQRILGHEMLHLMTRPFALPVISLSTKVALLEGIATASEGFRGDLSIHQWARVMRDLGKAPDLASIMGPVGFWRQQGARSYLIAGSFSLFLREAYGPQKLKDVYAWGNFEEVYGASLAQLQGEWEQMLETVQVGRMEAKVAEDLFTRRAIFDRPCARSTARLLDRADTLYRKRPTKAAELYRRAMKRQPGNLRIIEDLMHVLYRLKQWDEAALLAHEVEQHASASARQRSAAVLFLSDLAWMQGRSEESERGWRQVKKENSHIALHRGASFRLAAISNEQGGNELVTSLVHARPELAFAIRRHVLHHPDDPLGWYLLGRQNYREQDWKGAEENLDHALSIGLVDDSLAYEAWRQLGLVRYRLDDLSGAEESFRQALLLAPTTGRKMLIEQLIDRCTWAKEYRSGSSL